MLSNYQILVRLLLATALSGVIGFERESRGRAAGLRTHILVCVGSTLIMMVSMYIFDLYKGVAVVDPSRIAAQVVTGMGFLGAGAILRSGDTVKGLTTAASLWVVSGIGLAIGCGFYFAGIIASILAFMTLVIFSKMEAALAMKAHPKKSE